MLVNEKLELFKLGIKGKKIAVLGIGRSNIPAIKYLNKLGAKISVRDKNKDSLDKIKELQKGEVEIIVGENYLSNLDKFDYILRTPGIKPFLKEIEQATKNGVKLTSEIELLLELAPCKVVGVTGSDGKTTTTTLISKFLEKAGYRVWLGGNIGKSVFAEIDNMKKEDIIVLELSSFQLMTLKKSPNISVITNISPNHLDYHRDFEEYVMAKANIFLNQNKNDILVLNEDDIEFSKKYEEVILHKKLKTTVKKFSIQSDVKTGVYLDDDKLIYIDNDNTTQVCCKNDIKLIGKHNIANVCAAICAVATLVKKEDIIDVLHNFYGVEHRMEFVREIDGVKYYNDSIASSPTRTIAGLNLIKKLS